MLQVAIALNVSGLTLLFIGNLLVTNAVTRFNAARNPRFKWGNRLQIVGFVVSLVAISISSL